MKEHTIPAGNIKRIHVDQHVIRANKKYGTDDPAITVQTAMRSPTGSRSWKCHRASWDGPTEIVSGEKPLSCGARVWVETHAEVRVVVEG